MRSDLQKRVIVVAKALEKVAIIPSNDNKVTLPGLVETLYGFLKDPKLYETPSNKVPFMSLLSNIDDHINALRTNANESFERASGKPGLIKRIFGT